MYSPKINVNPEDKTETFDFSEIKEVVMKHIGSPNLFWRNLFVEIANQLAEIENFEKLEAPEVVENENKPKKNYDSAKDSEAYLEIELNTHSSPSLLVKFSSSNEASNSNSNEILVKFYKIDLELLFSRDPFLQRGRKLFKK